MSEARRLTVLAERTAALETCGYCPKLCRGSCPVSETQGSEALIPWGKMSMTWYAARGDLEPDRDVAALAWGCTGCYACRERCEHQNPVVETLRAARAVHRDAGLAPEGSEIALRGFHARRDRLASRARALGVSDSPSVSLLVGCGYLSLRSSEASDAVLAARAMFGRVRVLEGCCGLAYREAGDVMAADTARQALLAEKGSRQLVVADAGCALELRDAGARTLVEVAAERESRLGRVPALAAGVRYHDPCRLGRGLGQYAEPRRVLERATGSAPAEFERNERAGLCSGAGGMLPFSMPETARAIVRERLGEHEALGGGTLVTGCAASLRWFRLAGANVLDLATVIARSLGRE